MAVLDVIGFGQEAIGLLSFHLSNLRFFFFNPDDYDSRKINETWTGINIYTLSISTQNEGSIDINASALICCGEPDIIEERPQKRQQCTSSSTPMKPNV